MGHIVDNKRIPKVPKKCRTCFGELKSKKVNVAEEGEPAQYEWVMAHTSKTEKAKCDIIKSKPRARSVYNGHSWVRRF